MTEASTTDGLRLPREAAVLVHETAIVEDGAALGEGTKVWHHSHVRAGASIGADCVLGKNVFVDEGVVIGNRVKLQNNVSVYNGVTLADEVFVGPSAVFTNDLLPRADNPGWTVVTTAVGKGAAIGANATIVCGLELRPWSTVAAGAVVTKSTEDNELVAGNPARRMGWMCRCGVVASRTTEARPVFPGCECGRTEW